MVSDGANVSHGIVSCRRYAVHLLDRYLMARRDYRTGCLPRARQLLSRNCILISGRLYGNYLACSYVVVKLLYCINAVGQLFLLDLFLGYDFHGLGVHVIKHLLFHDKWIPSERPVALTVLLSSTYDHIVSCVFLRI